VILPSGGARGAGDGEHGRDADTRAREGPAVRGRWQVTGGLPGSWARLRAARGGCKVTHRCRSGFRRAAA
jgi:hypothetical protein